MKATRAASWAVGLSARFRQDHTESKLNIYNCAPLSTYVFPTRPAPLLHSPARLDRGRDDRQEPGQPYH